MITEHIGVKESEADNTHLKNLLHTFAGTTMADLASQSGSITGCMNRVMTDTTLTICRLMEQCETIEDFVKVQEGLKKAVQQ